VTLAASLLDKLAYPRVLTALADRAATRLGVERAEALAPLADPDRKSVV